MAMLQKLHMVSTRSWASCRADLHRPCPSQTPMISILDTLPSPTAMPTFSELAIQPHDRSPSFYSPILTSFALPMRRLLASRSRVSQRSIPSFVRGSKRRNVARRHSGKRLVRVLPSLVTLYLTALVGIGQ